MTPPAPLPPLNPAPEDAAMRLKAFLDPVVEQVEVPEYIAADPVAFMHRYDDAENRNLAGFLSALLAWGRRDIVIAKIADLLARFGSSPSDFIGNLSPADEVRLEGFKHRTFTAEDIRWIVRGLSLILREHGSFESFWRRCYRDSGPGRPLLSLFHERFFGMIPDAPVRVRKHISSPDKNSSCKRLWLFLRWTVRQGSCVDPGTMPFMPPSELMVPLDVHVARYSRMFGLLTRRANDGKAVAEITGHLRRMDPDDPARYDYALFGLGVNAIPIPQEFVVNTPV
ncbi:TIGR02757 family protein [Balneolales bacterium ANBcel1]|nr:TIGR02757 family protein [Balneolales bacterium ANBcel1]